jgi:hypothetical protein
MSEKKSAAGQEIQVRMPIGHPPMMANVTNVLIAGSHVILDFGFVDPGLVGELANQINPIVEATLVNRVVMSEAEANQFLDRLGKALQLMKEAGAR